MKHQYPLALLVLGLASIPAVARTGGSSTSNPPRDAFSQWRRDHGGAWRMDVDPHTGYGRFIYGGSVPAASRPKNDADFAVSARAALDATQAMHGLDAATLVHDEVAFLPLGMIGTTDKTSVQFRQKVGDVPVEGGFASVLMTLDGAWISVDTTGVPDLAGFDTTPSLDEGRAVRRAVDLFTDATGLSPTRVGAASLVIDPIVRNERLVPVLAWKVDVQVALPDSETEGFTYFVDARDGSLVERKASVHHFDVSGNVKSNVTPGDRPDVAGNPPAPQDMRYISITSSAGNAQADADGNFVIPGATPPITLTVQFSGQFANVLNAAGGNHVVNHVATQATGNNVLMNPQSISTVTAEGNAYNWINRLRDFVRSVNPTDAHADFVAAANVNLPAPCNALYDGMAVNFFIQNICVNSAYSTVVVHEMGHWLNDQYGSGNGNDGFGEGNADVYAMYIVDSPIVGREFQGSAAIRTGENVRPFCGDCCIGCYNEVHDDGEVLMGALWKVRKRLKLTHGVAPGGAIADSLFFAWMNAYNDGQIRSIIETHWLTLDDDNGNLSDGTPHYPDIDGGFRAQGFPGVDITSCPTPTTFCTAAPNSASPTGASMSWGGTTDVSNNNFVLMTSGLPPNKLCLYIYGQDQDGNHVFGNGFRCIDSPFYRIYPAVHASAFGEVVYPVNLGALPPAGQISAGQSWGFMCWYRDPPAGGAFFNGSEGLSTTWCQ